MKTEFTDVSETQKTLTIEIPTDIVSAEIDRVARGYTKQARIPGFRPGKVPTGVVKQRFRDQILHDVMHGLIPRAVEDALQARGIEPISAPDIKDVNVKEGQPLTFTAAIETVPPFDPGDLSTIALLQHEVNVTDDAVAQTLHQLRERAARYESIEGRPVAEGDAIVADLTRTDAKGETERHDNITIDLGAKGNPPGFDANILGLSAGEHKTFDVHFPADYPVAELADGNLTYNVTVKEIRRKTLPELDDEFAKDVGDFESLDALRDRVRSDMVADAEEHARRHVRTELLKQLATRVTFDLPRSLVEREMDRRIEEFARQLMSQNVDPRQAGLDWAELRESQRDPARESVASALALDEVARREGITVSTEDVDKEIERYAHRAGKTPAALRAQLEKEGDISRLHAGLRREKAIDLALSRAKMSSVPQTTGDE